MMKIGSGASRRGDPKPPSEKLSVFRVVGPWHAITSAMANAMTNAVASAMATQIDA
jgi:hypothetical protein